MFLNVIIATRFFLNQKKKLNFVATYAEHYQLYKIYKIQNTHI